MAIRLFFLAIEEPSTASTEQLRRQRAKLSAVSLTESELGAVSAILAEFHDRYAAYSLQYRQAVTIALAAHNTIDHQSWWTYRDSIVDNTHSQLRQVLVSSSMKRLEDYIRSRKTKMRIIPAPDMSQNNEINSK